jgi:hypothetical protein
MHVFDHIIYALVCIFILRLELFGGICVQHNGGDSCIQKLMGSNQGHVSASRVYRSSGSFHACRELDMTRRWECISMSGWQGKATGLVWPHPHPAVKLKKGPCQYWPIMQLNHIFERQDLCKALSMLLWNMDPYVLTSWDLESLEIFFFDQGTRQLRRDPQPSCLGSFCCCFQSLTKHCMVFD